MRAILLNAYISRAIAIGEHLNNLDLPKRVLFPLSQTSKPQGNRWCKQLGYGEGYPFFYIAHYQHGVDRFRRGIVARGCECVHVGTKARGNSGVSDLPSMAATPQAARNSTYAV